MSPRDAQRLLAKELAVAAAAYQTAEIIPRCPGCTKPCCKLETLVLELDWPQLKSLWELKESRPLFDKKLSSGAGPEEIREGNGLYYIHGKACPAYDTHHKTCKVYDQKRIKPIGCSDFPVYQDQHSIIADLRCEALDLNGLIAWLSRSFGKTYQIVQSPDKDFPFLVTLSLKKRR